jgi:hypothetical protein
MRPARCDVSTSEAHMTYKPSRRQLLTQSALGAAMLGARPLAAQNAAPTPVQTRESVATLINGYQTSQMLHVAAKLRIADLLKDGPRSTAELATAAGAHEDSLYRLMRTLASLGIFTESQGRRFELNPAAQYLRSDAQGSLRVLAEIVGEEWMWRPWGALLESARSGKTAFNHLYGEGTFDWFAKHPEAGRLFDAGQAGSTSATAKAVTDAYDFSNVRRVVDVGGGDGTLLAAVLRANPATTGVVFDLPGVVAAAKNTFDRSLIARAEFAGGNFFTAVPSGAELYLMKLILHDWNDGDCQKILVNLRRAMAATSRVVVAEDLVCGPNQACPAKQRDINMLVRTGGRNRTEQEYRDVLTRGGFRTTRVIPTASTLFLIEATPA